MEQGPLRLYRKLLNNTDRNLLKSRRKRRYVADKVSVVGDKFKDRKTRISRAS